LELRLEKSFISPGNRFAYPSSFPDKGSGLSLDMFVLSLVALAESDLERHLIWSYTKRQCDSGRGWREYLGLGRSWTVKLSLVMQSFDALKFVSLRTHPEFLEETANLLNTAWPRSLTYRSENLQNCRVRVGVRLREVCF